MTSALAALLAMVAAVCLARTAVPAWHPHGVGVEAWHVVMAVGMVAMLVGPVRRDAALLQMLLLVAGLAWCVGRLVARSAGSVDLRLAVGLVAMAIMLVPTSFAPATAGMPGMSMGQPHGLPTVVSAALMLGTLGAGASAVRAAALAGTWSLRVGTVCEAVMAAGMAGLVVLM